LSPLPKRAFGLVADLGAPRQVRKSLRDGAVDRIRGFAASRWSENSEVVLKDMED